MKVIKPVVFQEPMLISTTAINADANYSATTTYALNAKVTYNSKVYQSLQGTNLNHTPSTSPTWWLDLGADNKHAMFDLQISTSTTALESMTVVYAPGVSTDTVALINVNAATVKLTVRDGISGPIVYESTAGLSGSIIEDWYQYFYFDPLVKRTQIIFYGIPRIGTAHMTLVFTNTVGQPVECSQAVFGNIMDLGHSQYGARAGIIDYSIKQTDEFGTISFVERAYSKRLSVQVAIENTILNRVQNFLYSVRATPSVWIASDDPTYEEALVVYGFLKGFDTSISYPSYSLCDIDIEGLT